ncbi:MAG: metallophosphoesterase family protein [Bacteroidota bacterium]
MKRKTTILAHLSDLHLSPEYFPERSEWFRASLELCIRSGADHIIITGDITNQARPNEFEHFRSILKEYDLLDATKMTVVIGNHDIYGGPYHAEDVLEFPSSCKATRYHDKVQEFYRSTKELFTGVRFLSQDSIFPFVKITGDTAIVGMNSVAEWSPFKNPLGSNGIVNNEQFELVKSFLRHAPSEAKHRFIAVHHHFHKSDERDNRSKMERVWSAIEAATMKMRKKKRLLKLFARSGIDGILHGHVHRHDAYIRKAVRCYNGGGTIIPAGGGIRMINFFTLRDGMTEHHLVPTAPPSGILGHTAIKSRRSISAAA